MNPKNDNHKQSHKNLHAKEPSAPSIDPIPDIPDGDYSFAAHKKNKRIFDNASIRSFISFTQVVVGAILLALFINHFVFQSYQVVGDSMVPTLHSGDRLIISKIGKSWAELTKHRYIPKRGEIVVLHNPKDPDVQLIKRVIAIEGDKIIVSNGKVTVCPKENPNHCYDPNEKYNLNLDPAIGNVNLTVPEGTIFVMGDNRGPGGSLDSRNELGVVPLEYLVGNLVLRIFPLTDVRFF